MSNAKLPSKGRFGTFGGVFTPCVLTILGVIMFLRYAEVVGRSGVWWAIVIVLSANVITGLTALSLSAIATNTRLRGGGAYFLISRSLGVEHGSAIGIVFFFAQAISVAMYVMGFSEALLGTFPDLDLNLVQVATLVNLVVFICVYIGAGWTIRLQYFILAALFAALVSFYVGGLREFRMEHLQTNLSPISPERSYIFAMFALFFPAVTGIMAGANMSGDLKDPGQSLPRGTLLAVLITMLVYLSLAVVLAGSRPATELISNTLIISDISALPVLITVGIFAATLSSALGSMMGAPRIFQAFARDRIFRQLNYFAKGSGPNDEPRRATAMTFLIAQAAILLANLDTIAPVITLAFLITYGTLNLAPFYEGITKNPSYPPRFRFCHWSVSLAGALCCLLVMFLLSPVWATIAIIAMVGLHWLIATREIETEWSDLRSGLLFERARRNLLLLNEEMAHPKNWRPIILAVSGTGWSRSHLVAYGHWLTERSGILSLAHVIRGDVEDRSERRSNQERLLNEFIQEEKLQAFPAVVIDKDLLAGVEALVQCHGLGVIRPNTVLVGWPTEEENFESFVTLMRRVAELERSLIAIRFTEPSEDPWEAPEGTLDIWWRGQQNGEMMLLLAHLLTQVPKWWRRPIRLLRIVENEEGREETTRHLEELCQSARIQATPMVIVASNVAETIRETSKDAALVFLGLTPPEPDEEWPILQRVNEMAGDLPRIVFVDSHGGMSLE